MLIFQTEDPMEGLCGFLSPLSTEIPIYREIVDEGDTNLPESYLLVRPTTDSPSFYGDGVFQFRNTEAAVLLVTKSEDTRSDGVHAINVRKVKAFFNREKVVYQGSDLGYNDTLKELQYNFSLEFFYGTQE